MTIGRHARWGGAAALLMMANAQAQAQTVPQTPAPEDAAAPPAPPAPEQNPEPNPEQDIVVTGSRIARRDFAAPNPVVSLNAANIQQSGRTNLTDFLQRVPALTNSLDSTQTAGSDRLNASPYGAAGLNLLDLRGLGAARTLVLVNGRRHVGGQVNTAAVDIGSLPTDLIDRVEVLTGGASAVYGADGVSGVVNFILKRDFDGIAVRSQVGISQQGDAGNRFVSVVAGRNFGGGRGNVALAYEFNADDRLENDDRANLRQNRRRYLIPNDADAGDNPNVPDTILQGDLRYPGESPYGAVDVDGDFSPDFRGDGQRYGFGTPASFYATGGDATPVAGFVGDLLPRIRRHTGNLLAHWDFSPAAKLSVEAKFAQVEATTFDSPSGNYPATFTLDNPFIPASIRTAARLAGSTTISSIRDNFDLPRKGEQDRRRTYRAVVALSGDVSANARYELSYVYGRTDVRIEKLNDRWNDRFLAALDVVTDPATGRPTCRSTLTPAAVQTPSVSFTPGSGSGCVPLNTFGLNVADPAAVAFVLNRDNVSSARITQQVANGTLTGDFGALFTLPGGPVAFAVGGEYRRETSRFDPNAFLTQKQWYQYDEGNSFDPAFVIAPSRGSFDVYEAFGELNVPLLADRPFAHVLSFGAAGRYSDYSTIGRTSAYSFNGVYAPIRDLSFRATYGQSVRAPNIGELFTPLTGASSFFSDPCYAENRGNGTSFRAANCAALVQASGGNLATFTAANNPDAVSFISGTQRGNPNLTEERARTWTAGAVLRPSFVPGLSIAADWYDIRLSGAISTPQAQNVAELCVDQPTLQNVYCAAITRRSGSGFISGFTVQPQNVAAFRTAGLDLNVSYTLRTARAGTLDLRFVGGYLDRLDIIQTPGAQTEDQVDQPGRPQFNFVFSPTWKVERVTLAYNLRWFDRVRRFPKNTTDANPDYAPANLLRYRELWLSDLQLRFDVDARFGFYGGVNNLTDQRPDEDSYDLPAPSIGRFLYAGASVRF